MDTSQYLNVFIEETKEHLQDLNECLLQLENSPDNIGILNEIFRLAHTLKGMSGTMGFKGMAGLTHGMENVLDALRNKEVSINTKLIDLLFKSLDALEIYLNNVIETGNEGYNDFGEITEELKKIVNEGSHYEARELHLNVYEKNLINKAFALKMNVFQITVVLNSGCLLKSARAFVVFQALERLGEIIKSEPAVEDIEDEKFDFQFTVIVITKADEDAVKKELDSISELDEIIVIPLSKESERETEGGKSEEPEHSEANAGKPEDDGSEIDQSNNYKGAKLKVGKTVRVEIGRLDILLNLVSELIIQKTRLRGLSLSKNSQDYIETIEYLERITSNLHDAVMKVRMVPIGTVFNRFPRMVRDISRKLGKEVVLTMSGEETELDRTVIDEIGDPLIHLLRNSIDHGIEPSEKRIQLGKPKVASINLSAYQDGNNVVIEVEDDGQGIDIKNAKNKALEKGLIKKDAIDNISEKEVIDLLFQPSLSTTEVVSDISGRGVGLDVVKTKIESLGGIVEVKTEFGKGSRFTIKLPLTLAIIQALLVQTGKEKYAIQLSSIQQIITLSPRDIKLVQEQEVILLRNNMIPIIRLDEVLKVPKEESDRQKLTIVIVKNGDKLTGLLVDKIIGQQEIVQKPLGKLLSGIRTITSATILGDGNVALILDVNALASCEYKTAN